MKQAINNEIVFDLDLGAESLAYLHDHVVEGVAVIPAALYPEMVLAMAADALGEEFNTLRDLRFHTPLSLTHGSASWVEIVIKPESQHDASFCVTSTTDRPNERRQFLATGRVLAEHIGSDLVTSTHVLASAASPHSIDPSTHYAKMAQRGIKYGPGFQVIHAIQCSHGQVTVELRLPEFLTGDLGLYEHHPALLDGAFQAVAIARAELCNDAAAYLPIGLTALHFTDRLDSPLWATVTCVDGQVKTAIFSADITLYDARDRVTAQIKGLEFQHIPQVAVATHTTGLQHIAVHGALGPAATLAAVWSEVLQIPKVAHDDDFFELGGDSLMASQIATKAQRLGMTFTPQQLLEHRSIAGLLAATQEIRNG